jgi:ribose transport system permease protein
MRIKGIRNAHDESIARQFARKVDMDARTAFIRNAAPTIVLIVMTVFCSVFVTGFMTWKNLSNLLYQMTIPLVLATGLTFVLLIGSIDLSIEGVMGFAAALAALGVTNSLNDNNFGVLAILVVVIVGTLFGVVNGLIHVKLRIPSFMMTFAMGTIISGVGLLFYKNTPATIKDRVLINLSRESLFGIPYLTLIAFAVFAVGCVILNYTAFGRAVYAIGDNPGIARATGINVERVKIKVFALCACTASIAGVLGVIRLKVGQVAVGDNNLFPTITAVTVGGLMAGRGGMLQTLIGVLIYTELANYLTLMGVDAFYKQAIQGVIILVAVALSAMRARKLVVK